jgi:hypothetical protein
VRIVSRFLCLSVFFIFVTNCARTGRPEGGPKDEKAPLFITANPPYESVNFNKKEIKIDFNEYIILKNLNKQLVVSPPMKNPPLISPQGTPSKFIKIEIIYVGDDGIPEASYSKGVKQWHKEFKIDRDSSGQYNGEVVRK